VFKREHAGSVKLLKVSKLLGEVNGIMNVYTGRACSSD